MTETAHDVIEDLRDRIRRIEARPPTPAPDRFVATGWGEVDALLPGGGFPRGALSELIGGNASGKTAIALAVLASVTGRGGVAAFVDARHELYPPAAASVGVDLDRLLLVRPPRADPAGRTRAGLWTAEALLACGAFEAVAIDLPLEATALQAVGPASIDRLLRRVRAAAEQGGATGLWLALPGTIRCPSAVRLDCSRVTAGWQVHRAHARGAAARGAAEDRRGTIVLPARHAA